MPLWTALKELAGLAMEPHAHVTEGATEGVEGVLKGRGVMPPERDLGAAQLSDTIPVRPKALEGTDAHQLGNSLADLLYRNRKAHTADKLEALKWMDQAPGDVPNETWSKLYHWKEEQMLPAEKRKMKLTPEEQGIYEEHVAPLERANDAMSKKLRDYGVEPDQHESAAEARPGMTPRYVAGRQNWVTRALRDSEAFTGSRTLSTTGPGTQRRIMMALVNDRGERTVVSIKKNKIIGWVNGKASEIGNYSKVPKPGEVITGRAGRQYLMAEATTKEIEAHTGLHYYDNIFTNNTARFLELRQQMRNMETLEAVKNQLTDTGFAFKAEAGAQAPEGFRGTDIPQLRNYFFDKRIADVLDDFHKTYKGDAEGYLAALNHTLTGAIFYNPLGHLFNVFFHWFPARGLTGYLPWGLGRLFSSGLRAIKAVVTQNEDYRALLRDGVGLMYADTATQNFYELMLRKMGMEIQRNPSEWEEILRIGGWANPINLVEAIYRGARHVLWGGNDVMLAQRIFELEGMGWSRAEAIAEAERHIPNYRIPAHVMGSRAVSEFLQNPNVTMFGRYHYGMLKAYFEMGKGLIAPASGEERMMAMDQLAALGFLALGVYPIADAAVQSMTNNKHAQFRRFGPMTLPYNLYELSQGQKTAAQAIATFMIPAPGTTYLSELVWDRNFFNGQYIYEPADVWQGQVESLGHDIFHSAMDTLAPLQQVDRLMGAAETPGQFIESQVGIVDPSDKQVESADIRKARMEQEAAKRRARREAQ